MDDDDKGAGEDMPREEPVSATTQSEPPVKLNVGGQIFMCSAHVLCKVPDTFLAALTDNRWHVDKLSDGSIFIDRDPAIFHRILTCLRLYGTNFDFTLWRSTWDKGDQMLFIAECDFYQLPECLFTTPTPAKITIIKHDNVWKSIHANYMHKRLLLDAEKKSGINAADMKQKLGSEKPLVTVVELEDGTILCATLLETCCVAAGMFATLLGLLTHDSAKFFNKSTSDKLLLRFNATPSLIIRPAPKFSGQVPDVVLDWKRLEIWTLAPPPEAPTTEAPLTRPSSF